VRDAEGGEAGTALNGAKRSEGIAGANANPEAARPEHVKYSSLRGRKPEAISPEMRNIHFEITSLRS
jgi:hypothetical protein